jgi:hypothetical protein
MQARLCSAPSPAGVIADSEIQFDRADDGQGNGNDDDGCQPGCAGEKQGEREMKERFQSFVVPQIRKFGQMAPPN